MNMLRKLKRILSRSILIIGALGLVLIAGAALFVRFQWRAAEEPSARADAIIAEAFRKFPGHRKETCRWAARELERIPNSNVHLSEEHLSYKIIFGSGAVINCSESAAFEN